MYKNKCMIYYFFKDNGRNFSVNRSSGNMLTHALLSFQFFTYGFIQIRFGLFDFFCFCVMSKKYNLLKLELVMAWFLVQSTINLSYQESNLSLIAPCDYWLIISFFQSHCLLSSTSKNKGLKRISKSAANVVFSGPQSLFFPSNVLKLTI